MGACFQAPHAAPGQRPMETFLCLTFLSFHRYPHHYQHHNGLQFNVDGLFGAPYNSSPRSREKQKILISVCT